MNQISQDHFGFSRLPFGKDIAGELFKLLVQSMKIDPPYSSCCAEALPALKAMTNFDADSSNRITFILAGEPDLATILAYSHFDAVRARVRLTHHLAPMSLEETAGYIDHGLAIAHCNAKLFSEAAKMVIFKRSGGIPRTVTTIRYQAILRAVIEDRQIIDTLNLPSEPT